MSRSKTNRIRETTDIDMLTRHLGSISSMPRAAYQAMSLVLKAAKAKAGEDGDMRLSEMRHVHADSLGITRRLLFHEA